MANKQSDVLEPRYDGGLIRNKYVKAGLFITKTRTQRNTEIKTLYRELDGSTTTLCYVSADNAIYELIANPSTAGTTDQDWKKLDFGVSDILVAKGTWDADNTTPVLQDTGAVNNGNDFYVVTGAATPIAVQYAGLFGGDLVTVKDGDWIISNGTEWFVSAAPVNWDSISGIPQTITDYVAGNVIVHQHEIADVNGLQTALDLKFDIADVGDHNIAWSTVPDAKLVDAFLLKANYFDKTESYSQTEVDAIVGGLNPLTTKGDLMGHNGTTFTRVPVGADDTTIIADAAEASGWRWGAAPSSGWAVTGTTFLTGATIIDQNNSPLLFKTGALDVSGFDIVGTLGVDADVNLFRFNHNATTDAVLGLTEVFLGAQNGNQAAAAWGNIMIGQNIATSLLPTGEFQGGRNIFIGNDIANLWATVGANLGTHNVFLGRKVANNTPELSYSVAMGYEAYTGITAVNNEAIGYDIAIGLWAMRNFVSVGTGAGADDENIAIGANAFDGAGSLEAQGGGANIGIGKAVGNGARMEYYNVLMGWDAGENASLGRGNIGIGAKSLADATGGAWGNIGSGENTYNVGVGVHTLQHVRGNQNIAMGVNAAGGHGQISPSIIGDYNVVIGAQALKIATGNYNSAFGAWAAASHDFGTTQNQVPLIGERNTFIGAGVTFTDAQSTFSDSVVIGSAFAQIMESNKIYIGSPTQNVIFNGALTQNDTESQIAVINSTTGELEFRPSNTIAAVPVGGDGAVQYSTSGLLDGDNTSLFFDKANATLISATNYVDGATLPAFKSFITGDDIEVIGGGSGRFAWSAVFGDVHIFDNAATHRLFANALLWGTGNTATIAAGAFGIFASMLGGEGNSITPDVSGNYAYSMVYGWLNLSTKSFQHISGARGNITGLGAFTHGFGTVGERLFSDGSYSVNISLNTVAQTAGHGANADNSVIIGAVDANIPSDSPRSAIIGGSLLKMPAATPDTLMVEKLLVNSQMSFIGDTTIGADALDGIFGTGVVNLDNELFIGERVLQNAEIILGGGFQTDMTLIGNDVLNNSTIHDGFGHIFIGGSAGATSEFFDYYGIFIGYEAGAGASVIGRANIAIGTNAFNGALGGQAGLSGNANNIVIGSIAANSFQGGIKNVIIGSESGNSGMLGSYNVILGTWAGRQVTGSQNTFLGAYAGFGTLPLTGSNNTMVGAYANTSEATRTVDNVMVIGNSTGAGFRPDVVTGNVYIGSIANTEIWTDHDGVLYKYKFVDGDILDKSDVSILGGGGGWAVTGNTNLSGVVTINAETATSLDIIANDDTGVGPPPLHNFTRLSFDPVGDMRLHGTNATTGSLWGIVVGALVGGVPPNGVKIYSDSDGTKERSILVQSGSEILVTDDVAGSGGMLYANDHSANYVDRSIVDKAYVDSVAGGWATSGTTTLGSGNVVIQTPLNVSGSIYLQTNNGGSGGLTGFIIDQTAGTDTGLTITALNAAFTEEVSFYASLTDLYGEGNGMIFKDTRASTLGIQYAAAGYVTTDRSLVDKGFADGAYWLNGGTTTVSVDSTVSVDATKFVNITSSTDTYIGIGSTAGGRYLALAGELLAGGGAVKLIWDMDNALAIGGGFFIQDNRATTLGLEYLADYSSGFSARSLIDKGFADGAYILNGGTTNSSAATTINLGTIANAYTFKITGDTGEVEYPELTLNAAGSTSGFVVRTATKTVGFSVSDLGATFSYLESGLQTYFQINSTGIRVRDDNATTGAFYHADYSTNGVALGDRWIPDKGYNDGAYWALSGSSIAVTSDVTLNSVDGVLIIGTDSAIAAAARFVAAKAGTVYTASATAFATSAALGNAAFAIQSDTSDDSVSVLMKISVGANSSLLQIDTALNGIFVKDDIATTGFYYAADYSTNGIANHGDRWIPDKGYVDSVAGSVANTTTNFSSQTDFGTTSDGRLRFETATADFTVGDMYMYNVGAGSLGGANERAFVGILGRSTGEAGFKDHVVARHDNGTGGTYAELEVGQTDSGVYQAILTANGVGTPNRTGQITVSSTGQIYMATQNTNTGIPKATILMDENLDGAPKTRIGSSVNTTTGNVRVLELERLSATGGGANGIAGSFAIMLEKASGQAAIFEAEATLTDVTSTTEESLIEFHAFKHNLAHTFLAFDTNLPALGLANGSASGANSLAIGGSSNAIGADSISIGFAGIQAATGGIGIGRYSQTTAQGSIMIGYHTAPQQNTVTDSLRLAWDGKTVMTLGLTLPMEYSYDGTGTSDQVDTFKVQRRTSGTPALNFGQNFVMLADNASNTLAEQYKIETKWWAATAGSEESRATHFINNNGVMQTSLLMSVVGANYSGILYGGTTGVTNNVQVYQLGVAFNMAAGSSLVETIANDAATNDIRVLDRTTRFTSGTVAAGYGISKLFRLERTSGSVDSSMKVSVTNVSPSAYETEWQFTGGAAGVSDSLFATIDSIGIHSVGGMTLSGETTQVVHTAHVQLTTAQTNALGTTPIQVVAAPAAGFFIQIVAASVQLNHVTTAHSPAGGGTGRIDLEVGAGNTFKQAGSLIDNGANLTKHFDETSAGADIATATALNVTADDDYTGGGTSTIDVYVQYVIVDAN